MSVLLAGVLAGSLHVVSGPDHLVAVTPLAMRSPARAMAVGAWWGGGHAVGAAALGAIGALARAAIDVDFLSSWAEFLVGGVLCGVGVWAFVQARKLVVHRHGHGHLDAKSSSLVKSDSDEHEHEHPHEHGPKPPEHVHMHAHLAEPSHDESAHAGHHKSTSFGVGVLHGAAGTGHLLGVLPSLALPPASAAVYLTAYGLAAICAMTLFAGLIGLVGKRLPPSAMKYFLYISGVVAIGLGIVWMITGYPSA